MAVKLQWSSEVIPKRLIIPRSPYTSLRNRCPLCRKSVPAVLSPLVDGFLTDMSKAISPAVACFDDSTRVNEASWNSLNNLEDLHRVIYTPDLRLTSLEDSESNPEESFRSLAIIRKN